jgi:DNA recombination protein RmuC
MNVALPIIMFLVGLAAGGGLIWFLLRNIAEERGRDKDAVISDLRGTVSNKEQQLAQRGEEVVQLKQQQAVLQTTLQKEQEKIEEKIKLLGEAEEKFKSAFKSLAGEALKDNRDEFERQYSKPVRDTLTEINAKITFVDTSTKELSAQTGNLVKVFQKPEVRGRWGEMHLRNVVEATGMSDRCDFFEQQVIGEDNQLRPDLVVRLPGERNVAVDAKATIMAIWEAADAADEESREAKLQELTTHVRDRIRQLGSKAYHQNLPNSPEFVVLFLPTEVIFSTALRLDSELLEFATKNRVTLAGPTILISLLLAIAHGWKQEAIAKNAKDIYELGRELYKRLAVFGGHLSSVGSHLRKSSDAYNAAVSSLESRVMPQARRFEQLGAAPADSPMEDVVPIETTTRSLQGPEFNPDEIDEDLVESDSTWRLR